MNLIVAVVGMSGSGKSVVVEQLVNALNGKTVYFGGVVIDEIVSRGLPVTEDNESLVRTELRKNLGMAAMAIKRLPEIDQILQSGKPVIIDGLYSYSEYTLLREMYGQCLSVVAVHSSTSTRINRLCDRKLRPLTREEVLKRDKREIENLEKGGPIALADFHLVNNGSKQNLENNIKEDVLSVLSKKSPTQVRSNDV